MGWSICVLSDYLGLSAYRYQVLLSVYALSSLMLGIGPVVQALADRRGAWEESLPTDKELAMLESGRQAMASLGEEGRLIVKGMRERAVRN